MICPKCGARLKIIDSRPLDNFSRFRRYKCLQCNYEETTVETLPEKKDKDNT